MQRLTALSSHLGSESTVSLSIQNKVGVITMSSASDLNCLSVKMRKQLIESIRKLDCDEQVKAIVIASSLKVWCAGADIKELMGQSQVSA